MRAGIEADRQKLHIGIGGLIVGVLATIGIEAVVLGVPKFLPTSEPQPQLPVILQGAAETTTPDRIRAYLKRVREQFPVGSEEIALMRELWGEGFRLQSGTLDQEPMAIYEQHDKGIVRLWTVTWTARDGRISSIQPGWSIE